MSIELIPIGHSGLPAMLDKMKSLALDAVPSELSKKAYSTALDEFLLWFMRSGESNLSKAAVRRYLSELQGRESRQRRRPEAAAPIGQLSSSSVNKHLAAIRKFVSEAADNGLLAHEVAESILRIKGEKRLGRREGNWLIESDAQAFLNLPDTSTLKGKRDQAILAVLLGAGLRRSEVVSLNLNHIQQREARWVIVNLEGKHGRIRSIPIASWVKASIDRWSVAAGIKSGLIFRPVNKGGKLAGESITDQTVYDMLAVYTEAFNQNQATSRKLAPHDMRRTFAKLAHMGKASIEQIQKTLGHASIQTTEQYLGLDQNITDAPSDRIRLRI